MFILGYNHIKERIQQKKRIKSKLENILKLSDNELILCAKIHDIWKLKIPTDILHKRWKLEKDEWSIMEKHSSLWWKIISQLYDYTEEQWLIKFNDNILKTVATEISVFHHKTKLDWYPKELNSNWITPYSEFLRLCDIYDALRRKRAYKKPIDREKSISIIKSLEKSMKYKIVFQLFFELEEEFNKLFITEQETQPILVTNP